MGLLKTYQQRNHSTRWHRNWNANWCKLRDGPYAYREKLCWCIVGPIVNKSINKSVKCNRITVKDVNSGKVASHYFKIDNKLKR